MTGAASALRRGAHDGSDGGGGGVLNMDRLLSTVLLALTLVDRPYLLVDGADQPMSGSTHAPSLPQGKYDALALAAGLLDASLELQTSIYTGGS